MEDGRKRLDQVDGVDEWGEPKALCAVSIQRLVGGGPPELVQSVTMGDAVASIYMSERWVTVELAFVSVFDDSYVSTEKVCREYNRMLKCQSTYGEGIVALTLSIAPKGEHGWFLVGVRGAWSIFTDETGGTCNQIRFLFERELFLYVKMTEETVEETAAQDGGSKKNDRRRMIG